MLGSSPPVSKWYVPEHEQAAKHPHSLRNIATEEVAMKELQVRGQGMVWVVQGRRWEHHVYPYDVLQMHHNGCDCCYMSVLSCLAF
jgi:hypothetical protein